jgi:transposase InsO family protein
METKQKLDGTNYHSWSGSIKIKLQAKGFTKFIEHKSFEDWFEKCIIKEELQKEFEVEEKKLLWQVEEAKKSTSSKGKETQAAEYDLREYRKQFHSERSRWESDKKKYRDEWMRDQEKCAGLIASKVSEGLKVKLENLKPFEMWELLKKEANMDDGGIIMLLYTDFFSLSIRKNETLVQYLERGIIIQSKLIAAGEVLVTELLVVYKLLQGLSQEYTQIAIIMWQVEKKNLNLGTLKAKFSSEDSRRLMEKTEKIRVKSDKEEEREKANVLNNNNNKQMKKKCLTCKKECQFRYCEECTKKYKEKKKKEEESRNKKEKSNVTSSTGQSKKKKTITVELTDSESSGCLVERVCSTREKRRNKKWKLDCGSTVHLTNDMSELKNKEKVKVEVEGFNGSTSTLTNKGVVEFKSKLTEEKIELKGTLVDENASNKLMSLRRLAQEGNIFVFENDEVIVYEKNSQIKVTGRAVMRGKIDETGLYAMEEANVNANALRVVKKDLTTPPVCVSSSVRYEEKESTITNTNMLTDACSSKEKKLIEKAKRRYYESKNNKKASWVVTKNFNTTPPVCVIPKSEISDEKESKSTNSTMRTYAEVTRNAVNDKKEKLIERAKAKYYQQKTNKNNSRVVKDNDVTTPPVCVISKSEISNEKEGKSTNSIMRTYAEVTRNAVNDKKQKLIERAKAKYYQQKTNKKNSRVVKDNVTTPPVCNILKEKRVEVTSSITDTNSDMILAAKLEEANSETHRKVLEKEKRLKEKARAKYYADKTNKRNLRVVKNNNVTTPPVCNPLREREVPEKENDNDTNSNMSKKKRDALKKKVELVKKEMKEKEKLKKLTMMEWHIRYGHQINARKILELEEAKFLRIEGPRVTKLECRTCARAKMKRKNIPKKNERNTESVGEVVYGDLCGKISPPSLGGMRYTSNYYDDSSGYVISSRSKKKSEAFQKFKEARAFIKTQTGNSVKKLVTDGGGEYNSEEMNEYVRDKGIIRERTPPHSSMYNGKAERYNQTEFGTVRCMLKQARLPNRFWGEADAYSSYLFNRTIKPGTKKTRYELFFGRKPSSRKIHTFGTPVIFKDNNDEKKKLDDRGYDGIFVGINEADSTYRIYHLKKKYIITSKDVKFYPNERVVFDESEEELVFEDITKETNSEGEEEEEEQEEEKEEEEEEENDVEEVITNEKREEIRKKAIQEQKATNDWLVGVKLFLASVQDYSEYTSEYEIMKMKEDSIEYILSVTSEKYSLINDPRNYKEAMASQEARRWQKAIEDEVNSQLMMNTWTEVEEVPRGFKVLDSKCIYKQKLNKIGEVDRFKVRLVVRGFRQEYGIDFYETFAPVVRPESLRFLFNYALQKKLGINHLDAKTAFLNGELDEDIYIKLPEEIKTGNNTGLVKLNKCVYGLKQAPRKWYEKITSVFKEKLKLNLTQSMMDPCVYYGTLNNEEVVIALYVDDNFVLGSNSVRERVMKILSSEFKMEDLGEVEFATGIRVDRNASTLELSQEAFIDKILRKFNMSESKSVTTPLPKVIPSNSKEASILFKDVKLYQQLVGSLNYLSTRTRPDISYSVSFLATFLQKPTEQSFSLAKRVLRYLKGTKDWKLTYKREDESKLISFSDASYAEEKGRKSRTGFVFLQGSGAVSWLSKKQEVVASSSTEAEYIALSRTAKEGKWLNILAQELGVSNVPITIFEDNQSAIKLAENHILNDRSKHIDVRYHFIREEVEKNNFIIQHIPTNFQTADILTKSLGPQLHLRHALALGLKKS